MEGFKEGANWLLLLKTVVAWVWGGVGWGGVGWGGVGWGGVGWECMCGWRGHCKRMWAPCRTTFVISCPFTQVLTTRLLTMAEVC